MPPTTGSGAARSARSRSGTPSRSGPGDRSPVAGPSSQAPGGTAPSASGVSWCDPCNTYVWVPHDCPHPQAQNAGNQQADPSWCDPCHQYVWASNPCPHRQAQNAGNQQAGAPGHAQTPGAGSSGGRPTPSERHPTPRGPPAPSPYPQSTPSGYSTPRAPPAPSPYGQSAPSEHPTPHGQSAPSEHPTPSGPPAPSPWGPATPSEFPSPLAQEVSPWVPTPSERSTPRGQSAPSPYAQPTPQGYPSSSRHPSSSRAATPAPPHPQARFVTNPGGQDRWRAASTPPDLNQRPMALIPEAQPAPAPPNPGGFRLELGHRTVIMHEDRGDAAWQNLHNINLHNPILRNTAYHPCGLVPRDAVDWDPNNFSKYWMELQGRVKPPIKAMGARWMWWYCKGQRAPIAPNRDTMSTTFDNQPW